MRSDISRKKNKLFINLHMKDHRAKVLFAFDLDGTLAHSKSPIDPHMARLLASLIEFKKVLVISGAAWPQFEAQLISRLPVSQEKLSNLFIGTASGSCMYRFENGSRVPIYEELLSTEDKKRIIAAFYDAFERCGHRAPDGLHGAIEEDRGSQITFSACGQHAPLSIKQAWDPDQTKRKQMVGFIVEKIPDLEVRIGGTTSIDITKKGIDKAFGIRALSKHLDIPPTQMVYVGDALFPGGNDEPARRTGAVCIPVETIEDTRAFITSVLP